MASPAVSTIPLPDPFAPVVAVGAADGSCQGQPGLPRQRARRAAILSETRRLLAESGLDGFTLRNVSVRCAVTVQTLHNSFGCRIELLMSALNEHTTSMEEAALRASRGPHLFLTLADLYHRCATETPGFLRGMIATAFSTKRPLLAMQRHGATHKAVLVRDMARRGLLRADVSPDLLATQITRLNTFAVYEWSQHGDADEFHHQIVTGNRLLLRGALRTPADLDDDGVAWRPAAMPGLH